VARAAIAVVEEAFPGFDFEPDVDAGKLRGWPRQERVDDGTARRRP
jgi:hypothetical protein